MPLITLDFSHLLAGGPGEGKGAVVFCMMPASHLLPGTVPIPIPTVKLNFLIAAAPPYQECLDSLDFGGICPRPARLRIYSTLILLRPRPVVGRQLGR
jgi:hypothetical protein